ncbi:toxin-antitoxin system, antitoxin component, ribbon-helix-helix domain protein [Gemella bergeri ATCC 700627]|uniref:Toxin-antitoxin system, antitoxin component, ribbon-helix-helix domain protein n=2 Tax=Gemellaceae TaxID=539738 RepID=U2RWS7_9BACL|nr:toxin-antitoxin system, antitoxin component, ribbon-helix-helix domain protein [Gemella bergeri ATCC 700627]
MLGGEQMKTLTIRLEDDLHKKLKLLVIEKDTTIQNLIVELINRQIMESDKSKSTNKK